MTPDQIRYMTTLHPAGCDCWTCCPFHVPQRRNVYGPSQMMGTCLARWTWSPCAGPATRRSTVSPEERIAQLERELRESYQVINDWLKEQDLVPAQVLRDWAGAIKRSLDSEGIHWTSRAHFDALLAGLASMLPENQPPATQPPATQRSAAARLRELQEGLREARAQGYVIGGSWESAEWRRRIDALLEASSPGPLCTRAPSDEGLMTWRDEIREVIRQEAAAWGFEVDAVEHEDGPDRVCVRLRRHGWGRLLYVTQADGAEAARRAVADIGERGTA